MRPAPGATTSRLRIGIDATALGSRRGYGRFLRELLPPLLAAAHDEVVLFADASLAYAADSAFPQGARVVRVPTSESQAAVRGRRRLSDLWRMGRAVAREPLDVFFFPSVWSFFPVPGRVPVAVAFHDAIPERHGARVFPTRRARLLWSAKARLALRRARIVVTVSGWSQRALAEAYGVSPERSFVVPEAAAPVFGSGEDAAAAAAARGALGLAPDAPYLLYVGGFNPHKNLPALLDAFAELAPRWPGLQLLLVGDHADDPFHSDVAGLRAQIQRAGLAERVQLAGFVPDATLRSLYEAAQALVLPSLEEGGLGLPAVEAAACGTPCVATCRSPLPELLAGGGIFVEPETRALWAALERLLGDATLRRTLGARARECAEKLSWPAAASALRTALAAAAEPPR